MILQKDRPNRKVVKKKIIRLQMSLIEKIARMEYCLNIHDESVAVANVRRAFEYISRSVLFCNVNTYTGIKLK